MTPSVLITGVAGFTGRHLVRFLRNLPEKVRIAGIDHTEQVLMMELDAFHIIDLNKTDVVAEIVRKENPSHVIHLAAVLPPASEANMWYTNVGGTISLLWGLASAGRKNVRVVSIGSAGEYLLSRDGLMSEDSPCGGETLNGRTKWAQTTIALSLGKQLKIPVMIVRPFNLIGPGLPRKFVAAELCAQFARRDDSVIKVGNTRSERDFVDVRDAVAAYWDVAEKGVPGDVYNVCSGKPTRIEELFSIFSELTEGSHKSSTDPSRMRNVDLDRVYGDGKKLRRATGWTPRISLRQSLTDMLEEARR